MQLIYSRRSYLQIPEIARNLQADLLVIAKHNYSWLERFWSRNNPVDVLGDASTDRIVKTVEIVSADPNNDGILVIVTPQAMTDPTAVAKGLESFKKLTCKPILASWMGASAVADGKAILNAMGIPTFEYPDTAARALCYMWRYSDNFTLRFGLPSLNATLARRMIEQTRI